MITRRRLLLGFVLAAMLVDDGIAAQPLEPLQADGEKMFQLTWEVSARAGRPRLVGKIQNVGVYGATQIQLLVEQLDSAERPVAQQIAWLSTNINAGDSDFFDVPVADRTAAYRVRVYAFTRKFEC
jgi:hypothetical protein